MSRLLKVIAIISVFALSACSTSPKTTVVQIGDDQLSEQQIKAELLKLDETQREIDGNKGVTGTNIASVLFFWPGIVYTYYDASEAQKLIDKRRSHLHQIYNRRFGNRA